MTTTRPHAISTPDGDFAAMLATPDGDGPWPGILVLQEVFGVNRYIRSVCTRLADMGYLALAPDMFWRQEPGFTVEPDDGDAGMGRAFEKAGAFDWTHATADMNEAIDLLRDLPECNGKIGVIGFCFGGTLTFQAAADLNPDCAVSYYGSGVAAALEEKADQVTCPIQFHFGSDDAYLPMEQVNRISAVFGDRPNAEVLVQQGAGHAFDNSMNPMFSNPDAAAAAWTETTRFLAEHLR